MDKLYLFNPFNIMKISEKEIVELYNEVFEELLKDPNTMYEYAHNIEVYSNLNYITGEIIARLTYDIASLKTDIQIERDIQTVEQRKNWNIERDGKHPAMAYFEALGTQICKDKIKKQADKERSIMRFKNAYKSTEEKINALKKKMESIKFEEFNQ